MKIALLFLHGSGGSGYDLYNQINYLSNHKFIQQLKALNIDIYTPNSEIRKYLPLNNNNLSIWFNRSKDFITLGYNDIYEDIPGIDRSIDYLSNYFNEIDNKHGKYDYIIIGGFSMGGGMSLQLLGHITKLNPKIQSRIIGYICISSYLIYSSMVYNNINSYNNHLPVFMLHGAIDSLIRNEWGVNTYNKLKSLGCNIQFKSYEGVVHDISRQMLIDLYAWIEQVVKSKLDLIDYVVKSNQLPFKIINVDINNDLYEVIFKLPSQLIESSSFDINQLISHPILACDSSFQINLHPQLTNHLSVVVKSINPQNTASELSKRLYNRCINGSIDNPCQLS